MQPIAIAGEPARPLSEQPEIAVRQISPGYLDAVRMRVLEGRDFADGDRAGRPLAVLVSASTARRFWPSERPVGQRVVLGLISNDLREVVGVVSDVRVHGLSASDMQTVYVPSAQIHCGCETLVVRTVSMAPAGIVQPVIGAVHAVDPEQPVIEIHSMDEVIGDSIAQRRFAMLLLTGFASLALLLAAIGIYGVLSYAVRQRVQEIGIRMALGAATADVIRLILVDGLKPTMAGLLVGLAGSAALGSVWSTLVFGVTPHDGATFAVVSAVVVAVGMLASLLPACRAARLDPLHALRAE